MVRAFFLSVRKRFCVKREAGGALWSHPGTAPATVNDRPSGGDSNSHWKFSREGGVVRVMSPETGRQEATGVAEGGTVKRCLPYAALVILPSSKALIF